MQTQLSSAAEALAEDPTQKSTIAPLVLLFLDWRMGFLGIPAAFVSGFLFAIL